ncbi:MAG: hypothetical protein WC879_12350 [Melioribacteraceae bacterium]
MGHKRLGVLRKTKRWLSIVDALGKFALGTADISSIAQNTLRNVQGRFGNLSSDPSIHSAFEFLIHVSFAFQKNDPIKYLTENKILDRGELSLLKLARGALNYKNQEVTSHEYQTFARQAAIDAINNWYKNNLERGRSLFSDDIDSAAIFSKASNGSGFCELSRIYFSKLTERYLKYFLEREAAAKITNIKERDRFSTEIENHVNEISQHAFETAKIAQSFSAGWYNKNVKDSFPEESQINNFLSYALGKMKSELLREELK